MKLFCCRILCVTLISPFFMSKAAGQTTSTYIYLQPIYAFPGQSQKIDENSQQVQGITYTKGVYGSFGSGFSIQGGIGKMINSNFGFELAAEWHQGKEVHSSLYADFDSASVVTLSGNLSQKINSLMLKPILILRNSGDLLTFYSKLGLAIAVYSKGYANTSAIIDVGGQSTLYNTSEIISIKAKVGFVAAFGISARVSQSVAITAEVSGQMLSLPESSGYYNIFQVNGADQLPTMTTSEKTWTYQKEISTIPGDPNKPGTQLYEPQNFSYIGLSVGVRYYF